LPVIRSEEGGGGGGREVQVSDCRRRRWVQSVRAVAALAQLDCISGDGYNSSNATGQPELSGSDVWTCTRSAGLAQRGVTPRKPARRQRSAGTSWPTRPHPRRLERARAATVQRKERARPLPVSTLPPGMTAMIPTSVEPSASSRHR